MGMYSEEEAVNKNEFTISWTKNKVYMSKNLKVF